ncbi:WD repeat-containing protein 91-like [Tubulanus polymorphus]|uniref:WD repeat-containing protein 91-like n=1 Tax=Tubulanus polymorphus TaxID=672921 RepID=UPI003DA4582E
MASAVPNLDEMVKEYILFRGFHTSLKNYDVELKNDKDKGFKAEKIIELIHSYVVNSDLVPLKEYWIYLDTRLFSRLEYIHSSSVRKLEVSLYRWYLVTAVSANRLEKVNEFFEKMAPEIQNQSEWKEWFALPFIKNPEDNATFAMYFTKQWQDTFLLSLHNFLSVVYQSMPLPALLMFEQDLQRIKRLQEETGHYLKQLAMYKDKKKNDPWLGQMNEKLEKKKPADINLVTATNLELMDDFYDISQDTTIQEPEPQPGIIKSFAKKINLPTSPTFRKTASPSFGRKISQPQMKSDDMNKRFGGKEGNGGKDDVKMRQLGTNSPSAARQSFPPVQIHGNNGQSSIHANPAAINQLKHKIQLQESHDKQRRELLGMGRNCKEKDKFVDDKRKSFDGNVVKKDAVNRQISAPIIPPQSVTSENHREEPKKDSMRYKVPIDSIENTDVESPFLLLSQDEYNEHHSSITHCRFSETGKMIASVDIDGVVKVWALDPAPVTVGSIMSTAPLLSLEWASKADRLLLLGNKAGRVRLFDIKEKKTLIEVAADAAFPRIVSLACSPAGTSFVCASSGRIGRVGAEPVGARLGKLSLWDMKTMKMEKELPLTPSPIAVNCTAFNHNGQLLVTGGADGMIRLFDMQRVECIASWRAHVGEVYCVQFSSDENTCYSMGGDGKFLQWSIHQTGNKVCDWCVHSGAAGPFVASAFGGYKQMQSPKGKLFAFDAEGQYVLTCAQSNGLMYNLDREKGAQKTMILSGHKAPVVTVDWSTAIDCRMCLTGAMDGKVMVSTLLKQ